MYDMDLEQISTSQHQRAAKAQGKEYLTWQESIKIIYFKTSRWKH